MANQRSTSTRSHRQVRPRFDPRRWAVLGVLCFALMVVGIDGTIVNVALPTLVRELHATSSQLQWIVDAYTIVFASFLLIAGNTGDRLGRKALLRARPGHLRGRVVGVLAGRFGERADRVPGGAGLRRGVHHAGDAVDPHQRVHRRARAGAGDRAVGGRVGPRRGDRPAGRRLPARALLVGIDLPRQRPGRDRDDRRCGGVRAGLEGRARAAPRHPRRGAVDRRLDRAAVRHHRRPEQGLDRPAGDRRVRRRGRVC